MLNSMKYNLAHLTDFSGRDARQTFWFYVAFLFIVQYAIGLVVSIPMMGSMFQSAFSAVGSSEGGRIDQAELTRTMMQQMSGYMETQMWVSVVLGALTIVLLAASFVRRLHDSGFPGWIVLVPIALHAFALVYGVMKFDALMAAMATQFDPATSASPYAIQAEIAPWSSLGWLAYVIVIGFGVLKSQSGPNRYGGEPVHH